MTSTGALVKSAVFVCAMTVAACSTSQSGSDGGGAASPASASDAADATTDETPRTTVASTTSTDESTQRSTEPEPTEATTPAITAPDWLGTRTLPTNQSGFAAAQPTPPELIDRQFPTTDTIPPPRDQFEFTIGPLTGEPLERSTWSEECPVGVDGLRYITVSFWGFDGEAHTGELIIAADQAEPIVGVFETLHAARFPIEEMRVITPADLDAPPTGDSSNTGTFACRAVTGGLRFSEHAFGLAIDINPFHNPYIRGEVVLPELASSYLDREQNLAGMIASDSIVVQAFAEIGWEWGGNWNSLKDYQHFSLNNR